MKKMRRGIIAACIVISSIISMTLIFSILFISIPAASTESLEEAEQYYYGDYPNCYLYLLISAFTCLLVIFFQCVLLRIRKSQNILHDWKNFRTAVHYALFILLLILSAFLWIMLWRWGEEAFASPLPPSSYYGLAPFRSGVILRINSLIIPAVFSVCVFVLSIAQYFQLRSSSVKNKSVTPK
ncbi:MAG: hypothetical protein L6265_02740 [Thermoplasmatales archaeon]|nr:hypothetical protein [Thermoplasmatales archaeon]